MILVFIVPNISYWNIFVREKTGSKFDAYEFYKSELGDW